MTRYMSDDSPPSSSIKASARDKRRAAETLGHHEGRTGETMHSVESWGAKYPKARRFYSDYRRGYREGTREAVHHS